MNKTLKSALLSASVLLIGSSVFASNMGFKLVYPLFAPAGNTGTNWVSVPYFNSFATQDSAGMWADLPAQKVRISRYNRTTDTYSNYSGGLGNFALAEGEAYIVVVNADTNWTIVGSHDNAFAKPLIAPAGNTGTNWTSVPYHTNKTDAAGIWSELPASKVRISRYNRATDTYSNYSGGLGNFTLVIGEAYIIVVSADATWTPAHY
jgi:hypothetical protein